MTDKQINLAIGAITHAELVMNFSDTVLDALNSMIAFLATMDGQPERKKGKWIKFNNSCTIQCNQCDQEMTSLCDIQLPNYCPNCGADMREDE